MDDKNDSFLLDLSEIRDESLKAYSKPKPLEAPFPLLEQFQAIKQRLNGMIEPPRLEAPILPPSPERPPETRESFYPVNDRLSKRLSRISLRKDGQRRTIGKDDLERLVKQAFYRAPQDQAEMHSYTPGKPILTNEEMRFTPGHSARKATALQQLRIAHNLSPISARPVKDIEQGIAHRLEDVIQAKKRRIQKMQNLEHFLGSQTAIYDQMAQQQHKRRQYLNSHDQSKEAKLRKVLDAGAVFNNFLCFQQDTLIYDQSGYKAQFLVAKKVRVIMEMVYGTRLDFQLTLPPNFSSLLSNAACKQTLSKVMQSFALDTHPYEVMWTMAFKVQYLKLVEKVIEKLLITHDFQYAIKGPVVRFEGSSSKSVSLDLLNCRLEDAPIGAVSRSEDIKKAIERINEL